MPQQKPRRSIFQFSFAQMALSVLIIAPFFVIFESRTSFQIGAVISVVHCFIGFLSILGAFGLSEIENGQLKLTNNLAMKTAFFFFGWGIINFLVVVVFSMTFGLGWF